MATQFRAYRQAMKLRQKDVAEALGVSRAAYAHYEKGIREPNIRMLLKMADLFHVTVDDLLGHEGGGRDSLKAWELEFITDMNRLSESSRSQIREHLDSEVKLVKEQACAGSYEC